MRVLPLFSEDYVLSHFAQDFSQFCESGADEGIFETLNAWANRDSRLSETQLESGLLNKFFRELWGYVGSGETPGKDYTLSPRHAIAGASVNGNTGIADLALGCFGGPSLAVPQVLAEFKDVRSGLDAPQRRKGTSRTPVKQMFDYLRCAFDRTDPRSPLRPTWGIVTDMNEFRLYHRALGEAQYQRFVIRTRSGDDVVSLLDDSEQGRAQRFLFSLILHQNMMISAADKPMLEQLLEQQWVQEKDLERDFYQQYSRFRDRLYAELVAANATRTRISLLRATQRLIDRFIFLLFCEDMGDALRFPRDIVRDMLARASTDRYFDSDSEDIWHRIKKLFGAMERGGTFAGLIVPEFNGGLFQVDHEIDALHIPNRVFCVKNQGASPESLQQTDGNLLYLSACYNFGEKGVPRRRTIGLHTLGRIFEQSITDLEVMEAKAEGRESLAELSRRKRDGVYYTPEWVTSYVVEETLGQILVDIRHEIDMPDPSSITDEEVRAWHALRRKTDKKKSIVGQYLEALEVYATRIEEIRVLDPACGSGAFLIQALRRLLQERRWLAQERERIEQGARRLFDADASIRATLANNLYGVDINAESIEIAKLALWLHTAQADRPLATLDRNVRTGNSLIDASFIDFFEQTQTSLFDSESEQRKERVNVFDWASAFPEVFEHGGFDCIIGNPPYVKYQHLRKVDVTVAEYLRLARKVDGSPEYASAVTGNFDVYLPFIEKGLRLLNPRGRMGIIAPSLWTKHAYGEGLRRLVRAQQSLERWVDFGDFQVFEDATTYTALQFFVGWRSQTVSCRAHANSDLSQLEWEAPATSVLGYSALPEQGAWNLVGADDSELLHRLGAHPRLKEFVTSISVGVQTSADKIFHLQEIRPGTYRNGNDEVVELERGILRPIVSGADVRRYVKPETTARILFPYTDSAHGVDLVSAATMKRDFPKAWAYLGRHEVKLRAREGGKFDDDLWYRFGRNQNIDKQHLRKVLVPRLVQRLALTPDLKGEVVADNVDVCYLVVDDVEAMWYLLGVLNAPVASWYFRRTSKPFRGGYFSANKQFLAPIPIPQASDEDQAEVGRLAKQLTTIYTHRIKTMRDLDLRIASSQMQVVPRDASWLFADVGTADGWATHAPSEIVSIRARRKWGHDKVEQAVAAQVAKWGDFEGSLLDVACERGELRVLAGDVVLQAGIFVEEEVAEFVAAQWRHTLRKSRSCDGRGLLEVLISHRETRSIALRRQVVKLDLEIREHDRRIIDLEQQLDELVFTLYGLNQADIARVRGG
jgi:hypothetical protein